MWIWHLCFTNGWVHGKSTHVQTHQHRRGPIIVECIQGLKERLKFILGENVIMIVPGFEVLRVDLEFKTSNNAEVVPGTLHTPISISVSAPKKHHNFGFPGALVAMAYYPLGALTTIDLSSRSRSL